MSDTSTSPQPANRAAMFCRQCGYSLQGLRGSRCPECGQPFEPDDPATFATVGRPVGAVHLYIGATVVVAVLAWAMMASGEPGRFLSLPAVILMVGLVGGGLWMSFGLRAAIEALAKGLIAHRESEPGKLKLHVLVFDRAYSLAWGGGLIGVLLGVVAMVAHLDDPVAIGYGLTVMLLPLLYGALLAEFVFAPMQQVLIHRAGLPADITPASLRGPWLVALMGVGCAVLLVVLVVLFTFFWI